MRADRNLAQRSPRAMLTACVDSRDTLRADGTLLERYGV